MSDKNIDKDIELIKEDMWLIEEAFRGLYLKWKADKKLKALENILSKAEQLKKLEELRKYDIRNIELKNGGITKAPCFRKEQIEYMNLGIALKETTEKSELETYKKMCERLAEEVKKDVVFYDSEGINFCEVSNAELGKCFKHNNGVNCKQCIIDWARKEVENEKRNS